MKGFSIIKGRWWALLTFSALVFLFLPIIAGAQGEGAKPPEQAPAATGETSGTPTGQNPIEGEQSTGTPEGITPGLEQTAAKPEEAPAPPPEPVEVLKYKYFVLHSLDPELPISEWKVVEKISPDANFTFEQRGYFGFFLEDKRPKEPVEPAEPKEPVKPVQSNYADTPQEYKKALETYNKEYKQYEIDLRRYPQKMEYYKKALEKYKADSEKYYQTIYPTIQHYYLFTHQVPNYKRKHAVYRVSIKQPEVEKPKPPVQEPPVVETPAEEIIPGIEAPTEAPVQLIPPPPPAVPSDLKAPETFWVKDLPNDQGGTIAVIWPTSVSDRIMYSYIPEAAEAKPALPAPAPSPGEEEKEPEYQLNVFVIDAWVYYDDLKTSELPVDENKPGDFVVTANLSALGGDKEAKLDKFVGFDDSGLGMHFQGTFTLPQEPKPRKGLIRVMAKGPKVVLSGKVKFKKAKSLPVEAFNEEEKLPDNRYMHYFKLGIDYQDREGQPRWVVEHTPPLGVIARANIFNWGKWNSFLYAILLTIAILYFIFHARKGKALFVRRIAGLDHVEEAIGRATEMGKPILYVCGLGYMSDVATIAAVNILSQVAKKVADYDSQLLVPARDPIIMTVCQEVIQEAYINAGRPEAYNKDNVFFLTDDQFAYVAAVDGIMVREKPATNFFMGMFFAESLLLAETGAGTGAIQIAGTDALAQLPFFITTCDYTLIGEELYAASAYLSREPLLLGSLKGQDLAKLIFIILTVVGVILATGGIKFLATLFSSPL